MKVENVEFIPIYTPQLENYKKGAIEAIESGWISNHGKYIELATMKLREILNVKHAILMSNGTLATHCLLLSLKFKHPEITTIYVPNNVYVAVYNCVLMEYSIDNVEVMRIDAETWNICMDEDYIKSLKPNSAMLIVHNLGNIVPVEKIKQMRSDIVLLEDNCEGIFGKYNGIFSGTSINSLCSSMSFYGNKTITTGEGGAFVTQHQDVYDYIKKVYSQGMSNIRYVHDVHAYNYRMTNIQAAFLYDQLNDIDTILKRKQEIFDIYTNLLDSLIKNNKIKLQKIDTNTIQAKWIYAIKIISKNMDNIEDTFNFFIDHKIEIRPFFYPYHYHLHLKQIKCHDDLEISKNLNKSIILIPSYPQITLNQQKFIVGIINKFLNY
jgi:perosamine synthetase